MKTLAIAMPPASLRHGEVTGGKQDRSFLAVLRDYLSTEARPEEWLIIEWPEGEAKPTKYFFYQPE